eukprot:358192-Chlamydomonas_euryale.AAC.21
MHMHMHHRAARVVHTKLTLAPPGGAAGSAPVPQRHCAPTSATCAAARIFRHTAGLLDCRRL